MPESCTALILAAGEGRRMGGPKVLLELGGVPLVQLHVEQALALGCTRALVVVRPALANTVANLFARAPYGELVRVIAAATSSQAGSLGTLVRALRHVNGRAPDLTLLIAPVDTLPCSPATYRALRAAMKPRTLAATPRFHGRGGHPVLVSAVLLDPYLRGGLMGCPPLREVLALAGERRVRVDVSDASVVADADTPLDARALGLQLASAFGASDETSTPCQKNEAGLRGHTTTRPYRRSISIPLGTTRRWPIPSPQVEGESLRSPWSDICFQQLSRDP